MHFFSEFSASAIALNGNFCGSCIICLDHQSITIIDERNGIEIAKKPYGCISRFYLNEPGKFSFVWKDESPFGIREYFFDIHDVEKLEHALKMQLNRQSLLKPQLDVYPDYDFPVYHSRNQQFITSNDEEQHHTTTDDYLPAVPTRDQQFIGEAFALPPKNQE